MLPKIPKLFNVYIKPSRQTLSKAFDKSRTDLHQTIYRSCALLIIVDVRKNDLAENLTDSWSKDYYHLSI